MICGSTSVTSPTYPMSSPPEYFFLQRSIMPSLPLMPTALTPSSFTSCTRLLFTLLSTISAISMVGSSVTRRPPTKCGSMPTLPTQRLISLPPPWTMMGFKPISFNSTTSWMTCFFKFSSTMALPPYLTTTIFRLKRCMYGRASMSTAALCIIPGSSSIFHPPRYER